MNVRSIWCVCEPGVWVFTLVPILFTMMSGANDVISGHKDFLIIRDVFQIPTKKFQYGKILY